ncbi:fimbrillin family protein [Bacteroides sp. 519]|uniref:fimbrillin family protein n=1 Tax=Bacteroides sp. 519 TaxID=2302937 RepID=UPI0013D27742|nr:fimbrillin family protein [Bacteroides sp. 519]NDV56900.1 fimbrillin family protein [Bacteroides sp. 519]
MKQRINIHVFLFAISLYLLGCTNEDHVEELNHIQFGVSLPSNTNTRGSVIEGVGPTRLFDGTMQLYALHTDNGSAYINGDNVTMTVSGGVQSTTYQKNWSAQAPLNFYAVTPPMALAVDATNKKCAITSTSPYIIPSNAKDQVDLMFGSVGPKSSGSVGFEFKHALSRITFRLSKNDDLNGKTVVVEKVTLKGLDNNRVGSFPSVGGVFTWTGTASVTNAQSYVVVNQTLAVTPTTPGNNYSDNMFLFPHSTSRLSSVTLDIKFASTSAHKAGQTVSVPIPTTTAWEAGKWVNYDVEIAGEAITLYAVVDDWTDVPQTVTDGIYYLTVSHGDMTFDFNGTNGHTFVVTAKTNHPDGIKMEKKDIKGPVNFSGSDGDMTREFDLKIYAVTNPLTWAGTVTITAGKNLKKIITIKRI